MIRYYTDAHNVDEDMTTISVQGGSWNYGTATGITQRELMSDTSASGDNVASYAYDHHLLTLDGYHNVGHKIPTDQLIHMYLYLYKFI